jgi:serine/threonine protein kinase
MGIVFKAEDTKLGRLVALKFLPDQLAQDPQAIERFKREARAASALDHPSICTVYDIDQAAGRYFIAMQFLEGQTVRERIAKPLTASTPYSETASPHLVGSDGKPGRPFAIETLVDLAIQIADGLDTAHSKGITHRDIKPANIFVTTRGQAKILDFGVAKLTQLMVGAGLVPVLDARTQACSEDAPTAIIDAEVLTSPGTTLGTVAYMSPEQARGEELDTRSDLFSFGATLYEMATGRQAFTGATTALIFDAILHKTPPSPAQLNAEVPAELERIINKALEKPRDLRYQNAANMRADLERLKRDASSVGGKEAESSAHRTSATSLKGLRKATIATISVTVVLASLAWLYLRRPSAASPELIQKRLTFDSGENTLLSAALSPDSKYLAYSDQAGIHVKLLSSGEERLIAKPAGVPANAAWVATSWFPDGTQMLANAIEPDQTGSIWLVSMLGQSARKLRDHALGGSVSPDGTRVSFAPDRIDPPREIWIAHNQGDNQERVVALQENEFLLGASWAPDGQHLAYIKDQHTPEGDQYFIEACTVKGVNRAVIVSSRGLLPVSSLCWPADGRIVYSTFGEGTSNLWQIAMNNRTGKPTGEPKRITQWPDADIWGLQANADGKRLTFLRKTSERQTYLAELATGGTRMTTPRLLTKDEESYRPWAWTPDSQNVLLTSESNGGSRIFKQGIGKDAAQLLFAGQQLVMQLRVTPDGESIVYLDFPQGYTGQKLRLMRIPITGGAPQLVMDLRRGADWNVRCARAPTSFCTIDRWSQDGKELSITAFDPLTGKTRILRTLPSDAAVVGVAISPDGSTLAGVRDFQPEIHIRLLSLSVGADREITLKDWPNITGLDWAPDGKGLYLGSVSVQGRGALLYVDLAGNVSKLWERSAGFFNREVWATPSPDGRYLAINAEASVANAWMLEGF